MLGRLIEDCAPLRWKLHLFYMGKLFCFLRIDLCGGFQEHINCANQELPAVYTVEIVNEFEKCVARNVFIVASVSCDPLPFSYCGILKPKTILFFIIRRR
jgi:hypothetical protein